MNKHSYPNAHTSETVSTTQQQTSLPIVPVFKEDQNDAADLAHRYAFKVVKPSYLQKVLSSQSQSSGLYLSMEAGALSLIDANRPKEGGVSVDFASDALEYRVKHGGGKQEFVARAVGVKGQTIPSIVDATGGLGRDAFILASLGCQVTLIERSPVVAALLENGIARAELNSELASWVSSRLTLVHADSKATMQSWLENASGPNPDVVYLDPMFPHRKKSAAVKKEMRLFQQLLGSDSDANSLLAPALALANNRVVVKRPASAPCLADKKPQATVSSKKHRFDIYLT